MSANLPELISAYLDGEVTADERATVEQTLVESPTLRRVFYELRALQNQLARLPRYALKADLSREVLRRAERALLQRVVGKIGANATLEWIEGGDHSLKKNRGDTESLAIALDAILRWIEQLPS